MFTDQLRGDFCAKTFTGTLTAAVLTVGRGERGKDSEESVRSQPGGSQDRREWGVVRCRSY